EPSWVADWSRTLGASLRAGGHFDGESAVNVILLCIGARIMRIVIFGTGGAGGYFGAQLARAGEDVVFIARGKHLDAIRKHGLRIEEPAGETVIRDVRATDEPSKV